MLGQRLVRVVSPFLSRQRQCLRLDLVVARTGLERLTAVAVAVAVVAPGLSFLRRPPPPLDASLGTRRALGPMLPQRSVAVPVGRGRNFPMRSVVLVVRTISLAPLSAESPSTAGPAVLLRQHL